MALIGTLIVRADDSVAMGTGHVMRCLALAQAWQDAGGKAAFAMAEVSPSVRARLLSDGMEIVSLDVRPGSRGDARATAKSTHEHTARWVVVDGYHFTAAYQGELKAAGLKVLYVDDNGAAGPYSADLVLNQNAYADPNLYADRQPYTQLLLGSRYVMLRREFSRWHEWKREIPKVGSKILITMGGSDPDNVTSLAIGSLRDVRLKGSQALVVIGGSNSHYESLEKMTDHADSVIRLQSDTANMPHLMAWADVAVIAAGGTLWELLFMGCSVLSYARNSVQGHIVSSLAHRGAVWDMGSPRGSGTALLAAAILELLNSAERRNYMSTRGRELIDGKGACRICERLIQW